MTIFMVINIQSYDDIMSDQGITALLVFEHHKMIGDLKSNYVAQLIRPCKQIYHFYEFN